MQKSIKEIEAVIGEDDFVPEENCNEINNEDMIRYKILRSLSHCLKDMNEELRNKVRACIENQTKLEDKFKKNTMDRIMKNITYRLGNAIEVKNLEEAIEKLFKRDYENKKQIFVPEYFLAETPYDWKTFCDLLNARVDDKDFSEEERIRRNSEKEKIKREAIERNAFETLQSYFIKI